MNIDGILLDRNHIQQLSFIHGISKSRTDQTPKDMSQVGYIIVDKDSLVNLFSHINQCHKYEGKRDFPFPQAGERDCSPACARLQTVLDFEIG